MEFLLFLIFLAITIKDIPSTKGIEQELKGIKDKINEIIDYINGGTNGE